MPLKWQRHFWSHFQPDPAWTSRIHPGKGRFSLGATFLLSQLGQFGSFSSSLTRKARPQSLHPYSLPFILSHLLNRIANFSSQVKPNLHDFGHRNTTSASHCTLSNSGLLFSSAGILPAGVHSCLDPEFRQYILVQNEPGNDDRYQYENVFHKQLLTLCRCPHQAGPILYYIFH